MRYLFVDIETVPLKIEDDLVKDYLMDKKISKEMRSLDPNYSRIVVIGLKFLNEEIKILRGDEKQILIDFWNVLEDNKDVVVVTHNGYGFDIPFIIVRSIINQVRMSVCININKWVMENSNHFDTMVFFSQYGVFTNPNLSVLARLCGIDVKDRLRGEEVEKLFLDGDIEKIVEHCKEDIRVLEELFSKLCLAYFESKRRF